MKLTIVMSMVLIIVVTPLFGQHFDEAKRLFFKGKFTENQEILATVDRIFESLAQKDKTNHLHNYYRAWTNYQQALIYLSKHQKEKTVAHLDTAITLIKKSLAMKDNFSDSHRLYAEILGLYISIKGITTGAHLGPIVNKETAIAKRLDPKNPRVYLTIGLTYANTPRIFGGSNLKAIDNIKKAIEINNSFYEAYAWLGVIYKRMGNNELALQNLARSLKINPHYGFALSEFKNIKK